MMMLAYHNSDYMYMFIQIIPIFVYVSKGVLQEASARSKLFVRRYDPRDLRAQSVRSLLEDVACAALLGRLHDGLLAELVRDLPLGGLHVDRHVVEVRVFAGFDDFILQVPQLRQGPLAAVDVAVCNFRHDVGGVLQRRLRC